MPPGLVIHIRTNDFANGVKTMKEVRKLAKCVREQDKDQEVNNGFSSVIDRSDWNLEQEINDLNISQYVIVKVDNANIDESCFNNSKLHLNLKWPPNVLYQNIKNSLFRFWRFLASNCKIDTANPNFSKYIDQILFDLKCDNPFNVILLISMSI